MRMFIILLHHFYLKENDIWREEWRNEQRNGLALFSLWRKMKSGLQIIQFRHYHFKIHL